MIQFSMPIYELLAKKICGYGWVMVENAEEKVVELEWNGMEILFRFTFHIKERKVELRCVSMHTFRDGVLVSNDFEADKLREIL